MDVNVSGHRAPSPVWDDGWVAGDLVRVLTTPSIPEGEIARARLEDEGIPVLLKGEGGGPYRMGPVHLFVPAELEVQARLILSGELGLGEELVEDGASGNLPGDHLGEDEDPGDRPGQRPGSAG